MDINIVCKRTHLDAVFMAKPIPIFANILGDTHLCDSLLGIHTEKKIVDFPIFLLFDTF
jgi:hypothetical protein